MIKITLSDYGPHRLNPTLPAILAQWKVGSVQNGMLFDSVPNAKSYFEGLYFAPSFTDKTIRCE